MKALNWLLDRLKEKTTWGIIITTASTFLGVQLAPELQESITTIGLAIVALIGGLSTEAPKGK